MKNTVFFLALLLPLTGFAQSFPNMDEAEVENMLQDMEKKLGPCKSIEEEKMKEFEKRSRELDKEVQALCNAGKRDEAEKKAAAYGKEIASDPTMLQVQKCTRLMDSILSQMDYNYKEVVKTEDGHVCD